MNIEELLDDLFTYYPPTNEQIVAYSAVDYAAKSLVRVILRNCPDSPDRTHAIRVVRDARMWANASIACKNGGVTPRGSNG